MNTLGLAPWTLSARLERDSLEFVLGDGRRLAWRARQHAAVIDQKSAPMVANELIGAELAGHLVSSAQRVLNLQLDPALDGLDWERLELDGCSLAERFLLGRQLVTGSEPAPLPQAELAESLSVTVLHAGAAQPCRAASHVLAEALDQSWAREAVAAAHVLVLDGVAPGPLILDRHLPRRERLLVVLNRPLPTAAVANALDDGAAILLLGLERRLVEAALDTLVLVLGSGAAVGESVRRMRAVTERAGGSARLYGDPAMRFVRPRAPTSRRQITSLSFDIVGSTNLMQELGDEAYAELLSGLHARLTKIVSQRGGQPDDPQGDDGVMCYFGHPSALVDAAVHAVEAGLEIVHTAAEMSVPVRVGVATGLVAVKDGQPVGLSIHLAARLQQTACPGTVLASASTHRLVGDAFDLEALNGEPELKGIDSAGPIYVVRGAGCSPGSQSLRRTRRLTALVGRQDELARLHAARQSTDGGRARLVIVRGDPGMGKSRVVQEFCRQLSEADVTVLECRCRADASGTPYLILSEALRHWLGIDADLRDADAMHQLATALPAPLRVGEPFALLASLLGLVPPQQARAGGPRHRLLGVLLDWFEAFAAGRACCLIVEDWHWADPSMRDFIEQLLKPRGKAAPLVVLTMRGDSVSVPKTDGAAELIELNGLAAHEARELVANVAAETPLPTSLIRMLAARGDGVPLFLEEATRMALALGVESQGADTRLMHTVPESLNDLLAARLDGLGPAKLVAQVAAVVGREFSTPLLSALLDSAGFALNRAELDEQLAVLMGSGLVRTLRAGRFVFKHALVRDAAYASLWVRDRHLLHAHLVSLMRSRSPEMAAIQPELLAWHLTEAGLLDQALLQWETAARHAASRSAELEAIGNLRRALEVLPRTAAGVERDRTALRLQLLLAARLIATEGYGAAAVREAYLEARRLCDRIGDDTSRFKVEMGLEAFHFMRADFPQAMDHARRAATIANRSGDLKQRLQAHWGLACTLFHQGALRASMREMEAGLGLYTPHRQLQFGVQDPGVMCLAYSSWGLWELGQPDAALDRIRGAVVMAADSGHKFNQAVALAYAVSIELLRGETVAALARAEACIRVCDDAGFPVWLAITRCMRGRLLCEQGEQEEGIREMRAGYKLWLSTGALVSRPLYLALQTEGLMLAGQWGAAANCVDEGLGIVAGCGERQLEAELMRLRGELAGQRGDTGEAEGWLKRGYALAMRQHRPAFALRSATSLARLWAADGRQARARRLLEPLAARWQEGRDTRDLRSAAALVERLR